MPVYAKCSEVRGPTFQALEPPRMDVFTSSFYCRFVEPHQRQMAPSARPDERKEKVRHQMLCYTKRAKYNKC